MGDYRHITEIDGVKKSDLGKAFGKICALEGVRMSELSKTTFIEPESITLFARGKVVIDDDQIRELVTALHNFIETDPVKRKTAGIADIIATADKYPELPDPNELEQRIISQPLKKCLTASTLRQSAAAMSPPETREGQPYENAYWLAQAAGYESLGDFLGQKQPTDKAKDVILPESEKHYEVEELAIAVKKLMKAKGIKVKTLAGDLGLSHHTLRSDLVANHFSANTRSIIPQAMSKYGDYDTEEKIIRAADELEPMPKDMLKYRASIWKMKTIRGIRTDAINEKDHGVSHRCYEEATLPDSYISEAALRKFPAMFGCTSKTPMQELMEKAAVNDEDMQQFLHKGNNRKTRPTSTGDDETPEGPDLLTKNPVQRREPSKKAVAQAPNAGR